MAYFTGLLLLLPTYPLAISLHGSISAPLVSNLKDSVSVNFYVWKVDQRDIEM